MITICAAPAARISLVRRHRPQPGHGHAGSADRRAAPPGTIAPTAAFSADTPTENPMRNIQDRKGAIRPGTLPPIATAFVLVLALLTRVPWATNHLSRKSAPTA